MRKPMTLGDMIAAVIFVVVVINLLFFYEHPCEKFKDSRDEYHECLDYYAQEAEVSVYGR